MNSEELKGFLEENKENQDILDVVKGYVPLSLDGIKSFLVENEDGKKYFDSEKDKHFSKGLETWKSNNLSSLLEEEITKRFPEKTEEQKKIADLEAQLEAERLKTTRTLLSNKAKDVASAKGLPIELVEYFIGEDEEKTLENLSMLEQKWTNALQTSVDKRLAEGGRDLPDGKTKKMTREEFNRLSYNEKMALYEKDKGLFDELSK